MNVHHPFGKLALCSHSSWLQQDLYFTYMSNVLSAFIPHIHWLPLLLQGSVTGCSSFASCAPALVLQMV